MSKLPSLASKRLASSPFVLILVAFAAVDLLPRAVGAEEEVEFNIHQEYTDGDFFDSSSGHRTSAFSEALQWCCNYVQSMDDNRELFIPLGFWWQTGAIRFPLGNLLTALCLTAKTLVIPPIA